jgi:Bor protein
MKPCSNHQKFYSILLLLFLILSTGCYRYEVLRSDEPISTNLKTQRVYSFFWGALESKSTFKVGNCAEGNGLQRVIIRTNFGSTLVTFLTLGIVAPMKVQWECGKDDSGSPRQ